MLSQYLQQLDKVQLLSREEELALWKCYKEEGDRSARQELITAYQPLVYRQVSGLSVSHDMIMDLIQEGIIGLIEAVENYDYKRKVRFSTYAGYRIKGRMLDYLQKDFDLDMISLDHSVNEDGLSLLERLKEEGLDIEGEVEDRYLKEELMGAIERLPEKEQQIIKALISDDKESKVLADSMDISTGHFYRLKRKAVCRIRGMLSGLMKEIKGA